MSSREPNLGNDDLLDVGLVVGDARGSRGEIQIKVRQNRAKNTWNLIEKR